MKKRLLSSIMFVAVVIMLTSCYSSRKNRTGCPANPSAMQHVQKPANA